MAVRLDHLDPGDRKAVRSARWVFLGIAALALVGLAAFAFDDEPAESIRRLRDVLVFAAAICLTLFWASFHFPRTAFRIGAMAFLVAMVLTGYRLIRAGIDGGGGMDLARLGARGATLFWLWQLLTAGAAVLAPNAATA